MTSAEIHALVERFESLNSNERAILLDWARTVSLHYGAWQPFKRLYKTLDTRALDGKNELSSDEIASLAAMMGRLDTATIAQSGPRLQAIELPEQNWPAKRAKWNGLTLFVSGRTRYDWKGWRLLVAEDAGQSRWSESFSTLRRLAGLSANALGPQNESDKIKNIRAAWDFNARDYIGQVEKIELNGDILTIQCAYGGRGAQFTVDISDPAFPHLATSAPKPATWQYMKRRVRRLLRELSANQPSRYWALLKALLHESAELQSDGSINPESQWALMWALYGNGTRWAQKGPGRGAYRLQANSLKWQRTRREEMHPEIWNAHLDEMRDLSLNETVPVQANLIALQVLAAANQEWPALSSTQALRFLNSDVLWLKSLATRVIGKRWLAGERVSGALAAATILLANAPLRRQLQLSLENVLRGTDKKWCGEFMAQALETLKFNPKNRRGRLAAHYLALHGRDTVSNDNLFAYLGLWLELSKQSANWALERVRQAGAQGEASRLAAIAALPEGQCEQALAAFLERAGETNPTISQAWEQVSCEERARNEVGWRYLEATGIESTVLRELWKRLLNGWYDEDIFAPAFGSSAGANLFLRANWQVKDVADWFKNYYSGWTKMQPHLSVEFARAVMSFVPKDEIAHRIFNALPKLKAEAAPQIAEAFFDRARDFSPTAQEIRNSILTVGASWPYTPSAPEAMAATWRFLEASAVTEVVLQEVWQQLFAPNQIRDHVAPAIALLRRANLSEDQIEKWLQSSPDLATMFTPNFFGALFSLCSGAGKVALAVGATPEQWCAVRPLLLRVLDNVNLRVSFWKSIWEQLRENAESLQERLLSDSEILATFVLLDNAAVAEMMATNEDAHAPLLGRWLDAHHDELMRDDVALIAAATCPLPPIRERGLARVREIGLDLPLALRLIESNLPPAMELAQEWFQKTETGIEAETELALALCDSPQAAVRAWGRNFVTQRADRLLNSALLKNLSESGDAYNQAFVAQQLEKRRANFDTAEFDKAVLKSRGRARQAKNAVQKRLSHELDSSMNVEALLELARGRVPRDREWALQQLARLAQNGTNIDGVELVSPKA